jgi:hypothetical protein
MSALPRTPSTPTSLNKIAGRIATDRPVPSPSLLLAVSLKPQEFEDDTNDLLNAVSAMSMFGLTGEEVVMLTIPSKMVPNEVQNDKLMGDADLADIESDIQNNTLEPQDRTSCKQSQTVAGLVASDIEGHPNVMPSHGGATSRQRVSLASQSSTITTSKKFSHRDSGYFSSNSKRFSNASTLAEFTPDFT